MDNRFTFTKKRLEALPAAESGRDTYHDLKRDGLQLRVGTTGTKSFVVMKKIAGKPVRATLGRFPTMTIDQARVGAAKVLAEFAGGTNPNQAKKAAKAKGVTLGVCLADYLESRSDLAESTQKGYKQIVGKHLADWADKQLKDISRDMVADRHKRIKKTHPVAANNIMRLVRALFNFASGQYEGAEGEVLFADNPVKRISHNRQWSPEKRRQTIIRAGELPGWFNAVDELRGEALGHINEAPAVVADYLEFILLTGLRRDDALKLTWDQVELNAAVMRPVIHKKQKEVIALPLSGYVVDLLKRRYIGRVNEFVFPGRYGKGRLDDPKKQLAKVVDKTGIKFSSHDLRRTFITIAESLEMSAYTLKRLSTHSIGKDVTGGYVVMSEERLREPAEKVAQAILKRAGRLPSAEIVPIKGQDKESI